MAITNICGFETGAGGAGNESTLNGAGATIQTTTKRTGTYALKINPTTTATASSTLQLSYLATGVEDGGVTPTGQATSYYRFYINIAALPSAAEPIFSAFFVATLKFELRLDQNGNLSAFDSALASLGTGSTDLQTGQWYRIEVLVNTGTSAAWEVKIDGASELSGSTANLTTSNNAAASVGKTTNRNGSGYECYFDDFAVSTTAYPGAGAVAVIRPDGNGNYTAWTGVYTDVDDLVSQAGNDGDTTKWLSSTNTQAETATLESSATAGISGTINAVKSIAVVKRTSGSATAIQHRIRVNAADFDLSNYATTASYVALARCDALNPSDSAAWETGDIDTLEVGVEHNQSQSRQADCTMVCAMVDFTAVAVTTFPPHPLIILNAVSHAANW